MSPEQIKAQLIAATLREYNFEDISTEEPISKLDFKIISISALFSSYKLKVSLPSYGSVDWVVYRDDQLPEMQGSWSGDYGCLPAGLIDLVVKVSLETKDRYFSDLLELVQEYSKTACSYTGYIEDTLCDDPNCGSCRSNRLANEINEVIKYGQES